MYAGEHDAGDTKELIGSIMYLVPIPLLVVYLLSDKYKKHVRMRKMTRARGHAMWTHSFILLAQYSFGPVGQNIMYCLSLGS